MSKDLYLLLGLFGVVLVALLASLPAINKKGPTIYDNPAKASDAIVRSRQAAKGLAVYSLAAIVASIWFIDAVPLTSWLGAVVVTPLMIVANLAAMLTFGTLLVHFSLRTGMAGVYNAPLINNKLLVYATSAQAACWFVIFTCYPMTVSG